MYEVVGINLPNIPQYVISVIGTLRAGCVVSGVSPLLSAEQIKYQLTPEAIKDSGEDALKENIIEFMDEIPLTAVGKIDKKVLRK